MHFFKIVLFSIFSIALLSPVSAQHLEQGLLEELRQKLGTAFKDDTVCNQLFKKVKDQKYTSPVLMAYIGGVWIAQSRHVGLFSKMEHFNKGTEILDEAIRANPEDVETRFLRMTVQINAPGFLGYNDRLEEDKAYVLKNYKQTLPVLRAKILTFIKESDAFSKEEKAIL
jgi:hypothetical protein